MTYEPDRSLAAELQPPDKFWDIRQATIAAVSGHTATIEMGGKTIADVLAYKDVSLTVGGVVEVLLVGKSIRIVGAWA